MYIFTTAVDNGDLINALTEQNKTYRETLFWALGIMGGIISIFLTANFITSFSLRKNEIKRIKSELETSFRENEMEEIKKELKVYADELIFELKKEIKILNYELQTLENELENNSYEVKLLDGKFNELEGDVYYELKHYHIAVDNYVYAGQIYIEIDYDLHEQLLGKIKNSLEKEKEIQFDDSADLQDYLDKLPSKYQLYNYQINRLISNS
ncbi:hypothetical protein [Halobacillus campisalis]|uniref:Uncharacterized protein n=1 Tax=Halobacillus campisalis TaxID=435909 RepID=A0ABW2K5A2_9BACI|nr:hypothetical protein [Halobacillus campisalis]